MGVEYDIQCKICGDWLGMSCCKDDAELREFVRSRELLANWVDRGLEIAIAPGLSTSSQPSIPDFLARHRGHELAVVGDDGLDYSGPQDWERREPSPFPLGPASAP